MVIPNNLQDDYQYCEKQVLLWANAHCADGKAKEGACYRMLHIVCGTGHNCLDEEEERRCTEKPRGLEEQNFRQT